MGTLGIPSVLDCLWTFASVLIDVRSERGIPLEVLLFRFRGVQWKTNFCLRLVRQFGSCSEGKRSMYFEVALWYQSAL